MDYKKFHRTNVIIELVGCAVSAVWAVINLFRGDGYAFEAYMPATLAYIIKSVRILMLTGHEEYQPESYAESQKTFYTDNRTLYIISVISVVCSCVALVLVIIKAFIL